MATHDLSGEAQQAVASVASSDGRRQVLSYLSQHGPARANKIIDGVDVSNTTVHRVLSVLQDIGCVETLGDKETWRVYAVTDLGETVFRVVGDE